jgi:hypothetical protein
MEIQRNAPNLSGAKPCPSCQTPIARDAVLCTHCGYDFATGQKARGPGLPWKKHLWVPLLGAGIVFLALNAVQRGKSDPAAQAPTKQPAPPKATAFEPAALDKHSAPNAREIFEAKKILAEETFRRQLDAQEPPYALNEPVELRRVNGFIDKGTLMGFSGDGTNRVAIVAAARGEIGVPLVALDPSSRRRVDAEFREAFIRHVLSTSNPAASGDKPEI